MNIEKLQNNENVNRLRILILRFIRSKICNIKPVDEEYTRAFVLKNLNKFISYINDDNVYKSLYHEYKLGIDVLEKLDDTSFYKELSYHKFPELFEIEHIEDNSDTVVRTNSKSVKFKFDNEFQESIQFDDFESFRKYRFVEENVPKVKIKLISILKRYIALMELKFWIEKNGFSIPIIEFDSIIEELPSIDSTNSKDEESKEEIDKDLMTVKSFLSFLVEEKICDEENYNKLVNLIYNFLVKEEDVALEDIVKLKNGSSKRLGSALGEIFREIASAPLSYEYLLLGKKNINQFSEVKLNMENFQKSTLYKYYADKKLCYKEFR